jgi:hypothetical protein
MNRTAARSDFQPRWLAFCDAHGFVPGEAIADDRARVMRNIEFMSWVRRQWATWRAQNGIAAAAPLSEAQAAAFDAWLAGAPAAKAA